MTRPALQPSHGAPRVGLAALPPSIRLLAAAATAAPLALMASAAFAQDDAETAVQEVIITGSRVARTGFTTPTPTTVIGQQLLQQSTDPSIAGTLQNLPAFRADLSPATAGPRAGNTPGSSFANLRGLGTVRTLVLVNGQRVVPNNPTGIVDLNVIPTLLVQRIDVVTGGASAAYGSDAVSGVVNVVLDRSLQGFKGDVSYGQSSHDDNVERRIALAAGTRFADGRGHIMVGGEYVRNLGVGLMFNRGWGRESYGILPNPAVTAANPKSPSNPANLVVAHYQPSNFYVGGMIPSGPLRGITLERGGVLGRFDYGNIVGPSFMAGGSNSWMQYYNTNLLAPFERKSLLGRGTFEVNEHLSLSAEAAWANSHSVGRGGTPRDTGTLTMRSDNPFMPAALVSLMQANNLTTIPYGRSHTDLGASINDAEIDTYRLSLGGEGVIAGSWKWDAYAAYGKTNYKQNIRNSRVNPYFFNAIDAVRNASGQIVCRINADAITTNDDPACAPANIFGIEAMSQAARNYINRDAISTFGYVQKVAAANVRGELFSTWAGPVSFAAGAEHRREEIDGESDELAAARLYYVANAQPVFGATKVTEGYLEAVTPLAVDQPWAKRLEIDTAVRRTHYSTSGSVTTWKIGGNWEVNDMLRVRATRSRDIRAPNLNELFTPGGANIMTVINPANGVGVLAPQIVGGNEGLRFEIADTTTAGVVLRPSFVPGLELSVDYYKIDLKDAIGTLTAQQILDGCFGGVQDLCSLITLAGGSTLATGTIKEIFRPNINIATVNTKGWDFEVRYRVPLDNFDIPGSLTLQLYSTYMQKLMVDDGTGAIKDYAGEVGTQGAFGGPKWRATLLANYAVGPLSLTGTVRYVGGGKYRNDWGPADIDDNSVSAATYVNLGADYTVMDRDDGTKVVLYGLVQNLFSKDPPVAPTLVHPTNPQYYDVIGRTWKAGVRFNF